MPKRRRSNRKPSAAQIDNWLRQGLTLHQAGRPGQAEGHYRQVLQREPAHPAANHLLGLVRLQAGDPAAAIALLTKAVASRPRDPQYHCNLGVALNAAGEAGRALSSFGRAVELKPDFAEAWSNRGMALKALGRLAEAVEAYQTAIRLRPGEAGFHLNLANALSDLGDLHAAEASYRRALELRAGYGAALSGLAVTLEELGRPEEAVAAAEAALVTHPDEAEYHRSLGRAYRASGQLEKAAASYRQALALRPADAEVHRLLAESVRRTAHDDDLRTLERLHADAAPDSEDRMHLAYALGRGFDDLGAFEPSIGYFTEANAIRRRDGQFSLEQLRYELQAIQRLFDAPLPPELAEAGFAEAAPIFIFGLPRSGKSSLEGMLARHPEAFGAGELRLMQRLTGDLIRRHDLTAPGASLTSVPPDALRRLGADYVREARALAAAPSVIIDTMPPNFRIAGFIRLALPRARLIHCGRDPLDHCIALFQKHFSRPGYEFTCTWEDLTGFYHLYEETMDTWSRAFPGFIRDVDLGTVLADPERQMRDLLAYCGLDWHPACARPHNPEPRLGQEAAEGPQAAAARRRAYEPLLAPRLVRR